MLNLEKYNVVEKKNFFSINKFNILSFHSRDHGARKKDANLSIWVKNTINKKFKQSKNLTVYLLSVPRFLGYVFNPISIYFCIDNKKKLKFNDEKRVKNFIFMAANFKIFKNLFDKF